MTLFQSHQDSPRLQQNSGLEQQPAIACAICGAKLAGKVKVRLKPMQLVECSTCQSWTYLPRPSAQEQASIHDDPEYFEHPYFQNRRSAQLANDRRCRQIFTRLSKGIDLNTLKGDRLLDIGCDVGLFLQSAARQFGIIPVGVDVSTRAIHHLKDQGMEGYLTDLENAPEHLKDFSVITAVDLIEHVVDPRSFLLQIHSRLRPGGVVYLETPNIHSIVYRVGSVLCKLTNGKPASLLGRLFPPQHIQYFTLESFPALAQECGFEVVEQITRPLEYSELGTSAPARIALVGLQFFDTITQSKFQICGLLRKPT